MQCPSETEGGAITCAAESRSTSGVIGGDTAGSCAADKGKGGEESGLVPHRCFVRVRRLLIEAGKMFEIWGQLSRF